MAETAATANTNPENDIARSAQAQAPTESAPLSDSEQQNLNANNTQSDAAVVKAAPTAVAANAADETKKKNDLTVGNNQAAKADPLPNPLDSYPSYTYGLTLFALTKDNFNTMVNDPAKFNPTVALISSAGRYRDIRDPEFKEDFYFDNFKVTTVIGMNANARGTNAITMEFTIIEPYGMTLLDRIMHISTNTMGTKNYLDFPYLLKLDFFGIDDSGNYKKLEEHSKSFPIKLISFKIKAGVKGSEYQIQAVPFNHGANLESIQAIKARMEVTASTVNEFFVANANDPKVAEDVDTYRKNQERYAKTQSNDKNNAGRGSAVAAALDPRRTDIGTQEQQAQAEQVRADTTPPGNFKTKSFTAAYNAWNVATTKTNDSRFADQIKFVIDESIANSKIVNPKKNTTKKAPATSVKQESQATQGQDSKTLDTTSTVHSFEAGSTVNDIINAIIPNSEFFLNQVKDSSQQGKTTVENSTTSDAVAQTEAKTLKMWKIVPQVKLVDFDVERNVWSKDITFFISTYDVYQQRDKRLPKSPPPQPVKRYDYYYTGHNSSVINFDIDFNALYFTAAQVDRGNSEKTSGPKAAPDSSNKDAATNNSRANEISPTANNPVGTSFQTSVGGANTRSETQNAQSALQSIYTSAGGDMINLKMQILGDPHFIKQDDLFISPSKTQKRASDTPSNFVPGTQSLIMDQGEIYCYVTFRTPTDFDDKTGQYNLAGANRYSTSEFSGYYRVLTVESEFRGGKFTQTLNLIRYPEQDSPNKSASQDKQLTLGDNQRNQKSNAATNPVEAVAKPAPIPVSAATTPKQEDPAIAAAKGADNDGTTGKVEPPTPVATETQTTEDKKLAEVANLPSAVSIDEATPYTGDPVIAPPYP